MDNTTIIDNSSLTQIYLQLAEIPHFEDFDDTAMGDSIVSVIDIIYNTQFKQIETKILQKNANLLNKSISKLVDNLPKNKYHVGLIFLEYCHYFDLDVHLTYKLLHTKIQSKITEYLKRIIGSESYESTSKKLEINYGMKTVFDLIRVETPTTSISHLFKPTYPSEDLEDEFYIKTPFTYLSKTN